MAAGLTDADIDRLIKEVPLASEKSILLKSVATEKQLFEVLGRPYFASPVAPVT